MKEPVTPTVSAKTGSTQTAKDKFRVVFKHTLTTPYTTKWPVVPAEKLNSIMSDFEKALDPLVQYRIEASRHHRQVRIEKRKATKSSKKNNKNNRNSAQAKNEEEKEKKKKKKKMEEEMKVENPENLKKPTQPKISKNIIIGISAITRLLQSMANNSDNNSEKHQHQQQQQQQQQQKKVEKLSGTLVVFAFNGDLEPSHILSHFPALCHVISSKNSKKTSGRFDLRLIPLPKGTEAKIASLMRIKRAGAIAIHLPETTAGDNETDDLKDIIKLVSNVKDTLPDPPLLSWLKINIPNELDQNQSQDREDYTVKKEPILEPASIKQLETKAPIKQKNNQQQQPQQQPQQQKPKQEPPSQKEQGQGQKSGKEQSGSKETSKKTETNSKKRKSQELVDDTDNKKKKSDNNGVQQQKSTRKSQNE
ncbi:RNase P and RNase MRP subunit [Mycoemilia scoparia]|uniref:RNase P and RNase MRP subunit n=1 Tax=Mycoemilia scoparia TaxID=417184 RepID=A0A9W8DPE5_9FUNG|nr:RNase P and RNase MRP subunit [Mycoemilia scoparia]